jgi:putative peptide zinc metalloprotease protein
MPTPHSDKGVEVAASQTPQGQSTTSLTVPEYPTLASNVQLSGELQGSGFADRQWLIQRDGRFIQVTELLYRIAEHADGERTLDEIAERVTDTTDWAVTRDQIQHLIQTKLVPLGIIAPADGAVSPSTGATQPASPLQLKLRVKMLDPRFIDPFTKVLQFLYAPAILIPALIGIALVHAWLYLDHGMADAIRDMLFTPGALLIVLAITLAASVFHEFGHASALRYGGGQVRGMGAGLYLIYPALYTDVTDSYRLGRWARVRTDLGGFYFHLIFTVGVMGVYWLTGLEYLLVAVLLINLDIIRQCMPFVRFDGYWALADLTGIPDFFSQMAAFIRSILPIPGAGPKLPNLKPWVKAVFAVYTIVTIPMLASLLFLMTTRVPRIVARTWDALLIQADEVANAWDNGDILGVVAAASQALLLAFPLLAIAYFFYNLIVRPLRGLWRWSKPTPARRATGAVITLAIIGLAALLAVPRLPFGNEETVPAPAGVQSFEVTERNHVEGPVTYAQTPPVGGNHAPAWQNCGFYDAPIADENAVHSMEHGAVWITYRPDLLGDQVAELRRLAEDQSHVLVSPYPDLPAPVIASAWGEQIRLDAADDARLDAFIRAFRLGPRAPEPGESCTDGIGEPS